MSIFLKKITLNRAFFYRRLQWIPWKRRGPEIPRPCRPRICALNMHYLGIRNVLKSFNHLPSYSETYSNILKQKKKKKFSRHISSFKMYLKNVRATSCPSHKLFSSIKITSPCNHRPPLLLLPPPVHLGELSPVEVGGAAHQDLERVPGFDARKVLKIFEFFFRIFWVYLVDSLVLPSSERSGRRKNSQMDFLRKQIKIHDI